MKKNLILYILLGFLVLMNLFFLFNHFNKSGKIGSQRPGQANFISEQLTFDATQTQQFEDIEAAHREKMRAILDGLRELKGGLFEKLSEEKVDPSEIEAMVTLIAEKEKAKELETFRFFREVSEICNPDQKEKFTSIIKDALRRQGPQGRNGPPPGRPGEEGRPPPPRH